MENLGGYRQARAAYGVTDRGGAAYFEVEIPEGYTGHVRVGWSTQRGDPEAGVGYDQWQYGIRDLDGTIFHRSRGRRYGEAFGPGDRIGAYIYLPPKPDTEVLRPPSPDPDKPMAEIVSQDERCWNVRILPNTPYSLPTSDVVPVPRLGSFIAFFKNGISLGVAFRDIAGGEYYPSVSPYRGKVTANFGPEFPHLQIPDDFPKPVAASELAPNRE